MATPNLEVELCAMPSCSHGHEGKSLPRMLECPELISGRQSLARATWQRTCSRPVLVLARVRVRSRGSSC